MFPTNMAEVRLRVGKGAGTFFKNTYKQSQLGIEGKQDTSLSTVNLSVDVKNIQEQAHRLRKMALNQAPRISQEGLEIENPRSWSLTDGVFVSELYHSLGFKCHDEELLCGLASYEDKLLYECSSPVSSPRWFYLRPSQMTTHGFQNSCEQRRSICTMRFADRNPQSSTTSKLGHGYEQLSFSRSYGGNTSEPLYKTKTGYYDILQVPPNATHAQIKTAYYKQSFRYHPDKNAGSEDTTLRFSEISEAYNVLGNKGLRKKYDLGILSQGDLTGVGPSGKDTQSPTSQQTGATHSPAMGIDRANIFDFDNFIKSHYGDQLQREQELRTKKDETQRNQGTHKLGKWMEVCAAMLVTIAMAVLVGLQRGK